MIQAYLKNMISFLLVLPENPENDYLYIMNGFRAALNVFKWYKKID